MALAFLVGTVCSSHAQGVFEFHLYEQQPGGVEFYGGFGSFALDVGAGQFEVNVVYPYDGDSFTPLIVTPSGKSSFALGSAVTATFPVGSFGDFMSGVHYAGSVQTSATVYSDLLSGQGQLQLSSDSGVQLVGAIVAVPEPGITVLIVCGMMPLFWIRRRGQELHVTRR